MKANRQYCYTSAGKVISVKRRGEGAEQKYVSSSMPSAANDWRALSWIWKVRLRFKSLILSASYE